MSIAQEQLVRSQIKQPYGYVKGYATRSIIYNSEMQKLNDLQLAVQG